VTGGGPVPTEVDREDRIELVLFFRGLKWYAMPRIAFWGLVALTTALPFLPTELIPVLPSLPADFGWSLESCLGVATILVGFATFIAAALEYIALRGYQSVFHEVEWNRLAGSARLWLRLTLIFVSALVAGPLLFGPHSVAAIALIRAVLAAAIVAFTFWHRRLVQLFAGVASALGAHHLATSAEWAAGTCSMVAVASAALAPIIILKGNSTPGNNLIQPLALVLSAAFVYVLFRFEIAVHATADLLARSARESVIGRSEGGPRGRRAGEIRSRTSGLRSRRGRTGRSPRPTR
jgi:hypothetical protein